MRAISVRPFRLYVNIESYYYDEMFLVKLNYLVRSFFVFSIDDLNSRAGETSAANLPGPVLLTQNGSTRRLILGSLAVSASQHTNPLHGMLFTLRLSAPAT